MWTLHLFEKISDESFDRSIESGNSNLVWLHSSFAYMRFHMDLCKHSSSFSCHLVPLLLQAKGRDCSRLDRQICVITEKDIAIIAQSRAWL